MKQDKLLLPLCVAWLGLVSCLSCLRAEGVGRYWDWPWTPGGHSALAPAVRRLQTETESD